jgi:two-component system, NarL family, sensor kinase
VGERDPQGAAPGEGWDRPSRSVRRPARRAAARRPHLAGRLLSARDEERRRLARELHDTTSQNLSALALTLAALERAAPDLRPEARAALEHAVSLARQCADELYRLGSAAHPPLLDPCGLAAALRWYAEAFERRTSIVVELEIAPELGRLDPAVETALFRLIEECLSNVQRHSGCASALVRVVCNAGAVQVDVVDEGPGIDSASDGDGSPGNGIACMRERVAQLSGTLEIVSGPSGTVVRAMVPTRPVR